NLTAPFGRIAARPSRITYKRQRNLGACAAHRIARDDAVSMAAETPIPPFAGLRPRPLLIFSSLHRSRVMWQTITHCVFILSAIGIAAVDRMGQPLFPQHHH